MAGKDARDEALMQSGDTGRAWLIGVAAWLIPGGGHFLLGRWQRGVLLGGAVLLMFIVGLLFKGHLYSFGGGDEGASGLLQIPPTVANLGTGVLYLVCWMLNFGFMEQAKEATYEYGNVFLWVAGLLNYLNMLDAFDISSGRKL